MKKVNLTNTQKAGLEFLNLNTLIQRDNYIKAVVDYNINKLETAVLRLEELTGIKRNAWNSSVYWECREEFPSPSYWDYYNDRLTSEEYHTQRKMNEILEIGNTSFNKLPQIDDITSKYQKQTLRDEWIAEANQTFEKRLIHMVVRLDKFGFISENVNLSKEDIQTSAKDDFEFWISATDNLNNYLGRVHARLIWVNGIQYCSHYRFVTTLKK
jgi:hypothetical protein